MDAILCITYETVKMHFSKNNRETLWCKALIQYIASRGRSTPTNKRSFKDTIETQIEWQRECMWELAADCVCVCRVWWWSSQRGNKYVRVSSRNVNYCRPASPLICCQPHTPPHHFSSPSSSCQSPPLSQQEYQPSLAASHSQLSVDTTSKWRFSWGRWQAISRARARGASEATGARRWHRLQKVEVFLLWRQIG